MNRRPRIVLALPLALATLVPTVAVAAHQADATPKPPAPETAAPPALVATPLPEDPALRAVVDAIERRYREARSYRDRAMIRTRIEGDPAPLGKLADALRETDQVVDLEWRAPDELRIVAPRAEIELDGETLHVTPKTGPPRTLPFPRPGGAAGVAGDPHAAVLTEHPVPTLLLGDATAPQSSITALRRIERIEPIAGSDRRAIFGSIPVEAELAARLGITAALPVRFEVDANDAIVKVEIDTSGYFHPMVRRMGGLADDVVLPRIVSEIVLRDVRFVPAAKP